ncbi:MAG: DNA topoisomerase [Pseudomonadales bacterium]|jgi:DNA topoisomerase-3|uniref:DNA topoisomerase n=2 Tax=Cupriavidus pampae TaxID=659251 RepID=A0ABM8XTK4_9BURK|nr:DNA topoisomerase 3 [Cupriavidus pampae]
MSKVLIIPEKPSVAADIAKALGGFRDVTEGGSKWYERDDAIITNAIGHLVEITFNPEDDRPWDLWKLPIMATHFQLNPIEKTHSQLKTIGKLLRRGDVDTIVNACDAGREGELIYRYIIAYHDCRKPSKRMWMQSMTQDSIREAYRTMRSSEEMKGLFFAALSRSEADLLIGANATRGLTAFQQHIFGEADVQNAGRVQTPVTAMVVDRENEILTFKPRAYWEVHGRFGLAAGEYDARWYNPHFQPGADGDAKAERFFTAEEAQEIVNRCKNVAPSSVTDKTKPTRQAPPSLFDLTTLQRVANEKFKLSAKRTLEIAQALYETHKVLTYPRTDAKALPEDYVDTAKQVLGKIAGALAPHARKAVDQGWVVPNKRIFDNSKISDHFAIIPTLTTPSGLSADEQRIYDLVAKRFVAAFYPDAESEVTTRTTIVAGEYFETKGTVLVVPGWTEVYGKDADQESKQLVKLTPGESATVVSVRAEGKETQPPKRYTDASLLSAMEHAGRSIEDAELADAMKGKGLGTPATRAAIIEGLLNNKGKGGKPKVPFMERVNNEFVPTRKAMDGIRFLRESGIGFMASAEMTGEWEHKLEQINQGAFSRRDFMDGIRALASQTIDTLRAKAAATPAAEAKMLDAACPKCNSPVKVGKYAYQCVGNGCPVKISRDLCKRAISEREAGQILQGKSPELEGFVSTKSGNKFAARLVWTEDFSDLKFEFPERPTAPAEGATALGACPKCSAKVYKIGEHFKCEAGAAKGGSCDFIIFGETASYRLTDADVTALLTHRRTGQISKFKSTKTKKAFTAALILGGDGKVTFEFPERS